MQIIFYTSLPDAVNALVLTETTLIYNGKKYTEPCGAFINNYALMQSCGVIYLPLKPSLEAVCLAYLASTAMESGKLPRAANQLNGFLRTVYAHELPFDRASLDTLPFLHAFLCAITDNDKASKRMLETLFTVLRQLMMDLLLFDGMDISTQRLSQRVPSVMPIAVQAERELDLYIKDCARGRDLTLPLPMDDGALEEGRILMLNSHECVCPDLFARLCGFSLLVRTSEQMRITPLDCSFEAICSLIKTRCAVKREGDTLIPELSDADIFTDMLKNLECRSCVIKYTIYISAPQATVRKLTNSYTACGIELSCRVSPLHGGAVVCLEYTPPVTGTHFFHAMKTASSLRSCLLEQNPLTILGLETGLRKAYCDLYIDLPIDCMDDFFAAGITSGKGRYALLENGIVAISDAVPPVDELRTELSELEALEQQASGGPLQALRMLERATKLCSDINLSSGFKRDVLHSYHAPERAEAVRLTALSASELITARQALASTIALSVCLSLFLCAFPFALGLLKLSGYAIIPVIIIAGGLSALFIFLLYKIRNKKR